MQAFRRRALAFDLVGLVSYETMNNYVIAPAGIITLFSDDQNFCGFCGTKKLVAQTQTESGNLTNQLDNFFRVSFPQNFQVLFNKLFNHTKLVISLEKVSN